MGICVGGSFALIAAASPRIRDQVKFVFAYAPYSSLWTLAVDIASGTRTIGTAHEAWDVDPLTWKVYVRSVTDRLEPAEARRLQTRSKTASAGTRPGLWSSMRRCGATSTRPVVR